MTDCVNIPMRILKNCKIEQRVGCGLTITNHLIWDLMALHQFKKED